MPTQRIFSVYYLILLLLILTISCVSPLRIETLQVHDRAEWTVAIYMNGDNNLEYCITGGIWKPQCITTMMKDPLRSDKDRRFPVGAIKNQFVMKGDFHHELANPGSSSNVHVVALVDRTPGYSHNMDNWTETRLYYINPGDYPDDTRGTYWIDELAPEKNMGDPSTVVWFLETVQKYFPAKHLYLSMWDHNWGWHNGYFEVDFTNNRDTIYYGDLYDTLRSSLSLVDKIDVIGYDACVSSQIEVLHTWAPFASQFAGSQDYIGWDGVNYTYVLNYIEENPHSASPEDVAVRIAKSMLTDPHVGCTSSIELKKDNFYELIQNINDLGYLFIEHLDDIRDELIRVRERTAQVPSDSKDDEFHKDLFQVAENLLTNDFFDRNNYQDIRAIALDIIVNMNELVSYNVVNSNLTSCSGGHGITLYWTQSGQTPSTDYYRVSFSREDPRVKGAPFWAKFLSVF